MAWGFVWAVAILACIVETCHANNAAQYYRAPAGVAQNAPAAAPVSGSFGSVATYPPHAAPSLQQHSTAVPGSTPVQGDVTGDTPGQDNDGGSEDVVHAGGDSDNEWQGGPSKIYANISLAEVYDEIRDSSSRSGDGYMHGFYIPPHA